MKIAQDQRYEGNDWWSWSVWIEAPDGELQQVEKVVWKLHPTFPNPTREITTPGTKFRLETSGWGTFRVHADVVQHNGMVRTLSHELELYYPDDTPASA